MGVYRRGKFYWVTFSHNGKPVYQSTKQTDRKLAERFAASFQAACQEGRFNPARRDATVSEALARYLEIHLKPNHPASFDRASHVVKRMSGYFGADTPLSRLRPMVDQYKAWRKQTVTAATVKREIIILKAACRKALEWEMISQDPLAGYKLDKVDNKRVRYIEDSEFSRLINAAHPDLAPILLMARHTGMRQGELLALQWSDLDLKRGWLCVRHSKSGESRFVPLTTTLLEMLEKTPLSEREGFVFQHDGKPLDRHGFPEHWFRKAVKLSGLMDFRFHDLRHTFASHAAMRGVDVQSLAAILGHKTLRMTQRYAHLSPGHLKTSIELAAPRMARQTPSDITKALHSSSATPPGPSARNTTKEKTPPLLAGFFSQHIGAPNGIRTRPTALKGL